MGERVIGVIGGTGLYSLPGLEDLEEVVTTTPFGDPSDVLLVGRLGSAKVVFLSRHARGHRILPHEVNYRANIYALKEQRVEWLISVSAVGSMKEHIRPGDLVVVEQFVDLTRRREASFFGDGLVAHVAFADPVSAVLSKVVYHAAVDAAAAAGGAAQVHHGRTYLCIDGPQFSTRAESRIYRSWDVDVIGMTAMPEAKLAREAEMSYATLALPTDYDCWHESEKPVTADAVMAQLARNAELARDVVARAVAAVPEERTCPAATALKDAILTSRNRMTDEITSRLDMLVGKYLT